VSFDPTRLRFLGQPIPEIVGFPVLVVNPSSASQGELRVLAVDPRGLATHVVQMAFEVLRDGYENSLRYEQLSGETREGVPVGAMSATRVATGQEGVSRRARIGVISGSDWYSLGTEFEGLQPRLIDSVPTGSLYGDVSGNGGISVADVVLLSNWAVGNEAPVGTPVPVSGDFAELVGNVAPYNLPGWGKQQTTSRPAGVPVVKGH
jgi:hypothetical protein